MKRETRAKEKSAYHKADRIIFVFLIFILSLLAVFGLLTLIQPLWLQEISKPGRTEEAESHITAGNRMMYDANKNNDRTLYESARTNFLNALEIDSLNRAATLNLAAACLYTGREQEAEKVLQKLLLTDTAFNYDVYTYLGDLYERRGRLEEALNYYLKAIPDHNDPSYCYRKAGLFFFRAEKYDQAIAYLEKSISMEKNFEYQYVKTIKAAWHNAVIYEDSINVDYLKDHLKKSGYTGEMTKYDEKIYFEAHKTSRELGFAYLYLGDVYSLMGDTEKATTHYITAIDYYPAVRNILNQRGADKPLPGI